MKIKNNYPHNKSAYGGILANTRHGRSRPRPLSIKDSMHLVLKSTKAINEKSFTHKSNKQAVIEILQKFAHKHHLKIIRLAIVGNHMHLQIMILKKDGYARFIRAVTSAISYAIYYSKKIGSDKLRSKRKKFWDYRPFSKIFVGAKAYLTLKNYIEINQLEGLGVLRYEAKILIAKYNNDESHPLLI